MGRPTKYNVEVAAEICRRLADGEGLAEICRSEGMPERTTIYRWRHEHEQFRDDYARARVDQGHTDADEMREVRRKLINGEIDAQTATALANMLKWEAGKRAPKDFGDKVDVEHSGGLKVIMAPVDERL